MRRFHAPLLLVLLVAGIPGCAGRAGDTSPRPQEAAYVLTPGETLRYRKQSEWSSTYGLAGMLRSPGSRYRRDSRFAITFTGDGRARAWIESVRFQVTADSGPPTVQAAGTDVVELPFVLAVGSRGSDSVVSRPRFPQTWSGMETQFDGFFPKLPGGALTSGREWTDHGTNEEGDSVFVTRSSRYGTYRVSGTERIRGTAVVVVRYHATNESQRRWRNPPTEIGPYYMSPVVSHTQSEVRGAFYFAPRSGRLVRHTWTSETSVSHPSGHVEAAVEEMSSRVTIDLISSPRE